MYIAYIGQQIYITTKCNFLRWHFTQTLSPTETGNDKHQLKVDRQNYEKERERINMVIFCPKTVWHMKQKSQRTKSCPFTSSKAFWVSRPFGWYSGCSLVSIPTTVTGTDSTCPWWDSSRIGSLAPVDSSGILLHRWANRRISLRVSWSLLMCQTSLLSVHVSISNPTFFFMVPSCGELTSNSMGHNKNQMGWLRK